MRLNLSCYAVRDCEWCGGTGDVVAEMVSGCPVYATCACIRMSDALAAHQSSHGGSPGVTEMAVTLPRPDVAPGHSPEVKHGR
jgi:hypothetical protein